jgi:hypothetical protein
MQTLKLTICLAVIGLAGLGEALSQESWRRTNSTAAEDHERRIQDMRERGEQIRQRLADEYQEQQERIQRERREAREKREAEARANVQRMRYRYAPYAIPARTYSMPTVSRAPVYYYGTTARAAARTDDDSETEQEDEGFAAASGKCGDVTTQKIGSFYYHSNGGMTQKIGNFFYGPDGQVTQRIGNFYYHSDGTTTQRIGNFYYDSDGGVTQKIGSFYHHSGGKPCEDGEE